MDYVNALMLAALAGLGWRIYAGNAYNATKHRFVDGGEEVLIGASAALVRRFPHLAKRVRKDDIAKIQFDSQCISLFTRRNHAIDIRVHKKARNTVLAEARALFPAARVINLA